MEQDRMQDFILRCEDVSKTYGQGEQAVYALKNVSFRMKRGEFVAVMGPSGSGKSTLMNLIGCLDRPTSGTLYLDGKDISKCTENELADLRLDRLGFVFQNFQLLSYQTALENVELPLTYAGVSRKERKERAEEALGRVGLRERMHARPTQLSGGQQQRVAIARAIINIGGAAAEAAQPADAGLQPQGAGQEEPAPEQQRLGAGKEAPVPGQRPDRLPGLLLADEPTGALDTGTGKQIMELFRQLNREGISILMITHDPSIAACADRCVTIRDGELQEENPA